jgi:hypothetical protein
MSFQWLDFSALDGIDEELREIVKDSAFIDEARCAALCYGLRKRTELLREYARSRENPQTAVSHKPRRQEKER